VKESFYDETKHLEEIRGMMPKEIFFVDLAEAISTSTEDTAEAPKVTEVSEKVLESEREKEEASSSAERAYPLPPPQDLICRSSGKHVLKGMDVLHGR
jgi:hypothetical protein